VPEGSPSELAPRNVDLDGRGRCDTDRSLTRDGDVEGDVGGDVAFAPSAERRRCLEGRREPNQLPGPGAITGDR
jgi:hypothetical protein